MKVAPFPGAWIETNDSQVLICAIPVAPFPGAWIETIFLHVMPPYKVGRALPGRVD